MAGNSEVANVMQGVANSLKSKGGTTTANGGDVKCNSSTTNGKGPDLSGYGSGK